MESEEDCILRQRKEKKDLQARIQQLKHAVPKGDKKKKKEVAAEIAILEAELDTSHEKELLAFAKSPSEPSVESDVSKLTLKDDSIDTETVHLDGSGSTNKKSSRTQRRKEKKVQKVHEREERIKDQESINEHGLRNIEAEKLKSILRSRGLMLFEVPSDGNCLFSAIEDQLQLLGIKSCVESLRRQTAEYIRSHPDDFLPFLVKEDTGEMFSPDDFENYCDRLEKTAEWGGQAEIRALAEVLKAPVEVIQADGPSITIGENFELKPLTIIYYRHQFGLGEHYNSARPFQSMNADVDS